MGIYDTIIIGIGHNALITAAYLTRAGRSVLVLEKNDRLGGFLRTEELTLPGFKHDVYAAAHPLFLTGPAYADLGEALEARGLRYINTDLPTGVSMEDGRTAVLLRSFEEFVLEAEKLAPGDGAELARMFEGIQPYVNDVFSLFNVDLSRPDAASIITRLMRNEAGPGYSPFAASLFSTARNAVSSFKSQVLKAMMASWVTHLGRTPHEVGSGIWVPLTVMALMGGGMPIPEGGSEMLAKSLTQLVKDQGGVIRTNTLVEEIMIKDDWAVGVRTSDGEKIRAAHSVVACTTPDQLYLSLLKESDFAAHGVEGEECLQTISKYYAETNYLLDPHTSCGVAAYETCNDPSEVCVTLATAHPAKFNESIELCDIEQTFPEQINQLFDKPQYLEVVGTVNDEIVRKLEKHFSSVQSNVK
ncbi:phytoene dehydrogenase-like protein [Bacillus fengqiuensis]|nr:phytoene dehydrogenase-like protein [Bacillus fengqiuensis]